MIHRTLFFKAGMAAVALLALASCRAEEQGRPLSYPQGVYQGKQDKEQLSEAALSQLRERAIYQGGVTTDGGQADMTGVTGSDVRPPVASSQ